MEYFFLMQCTSHQHDFAKNNANFNNVDVAQMTNYFQTLLQADDKSGKLKQMLQAQEGQKRKANEPSSGKGQSLHPSGGRGAHCAVKAVAAASNTSAATAPTTAAGGMVTATIRPPSAMTVPVAQWRLPLLPP